MLIAIPNVTSILERSKKGVIPTDEGKILYEHIKSMFNNFNSTFFNVT